MTWWQQFEWWEGPTEQFWAKGTPGRGNKKLQRQKCAFCSIYRKGASVAGDHLIKGSWSEVSSEGQRKCSSKIIMRYLDFFWWWWKAIELLLKDNLERTFWCEHHVLYPNRSLGYIDVYICQNPWNGTLKTCASHYIFKRQKEKKSCKQILKSRYYMLEYVCNLLWNGSKKMDEWIDRGMDRYVIKQVRHSW